MERREWMRLVGWATVGYGWNLFAQGQKEARAMKAAFVENMLPQKVSVAERFELARRIGLDGVEVRPLEEGLWAEYREASQRTGVLIHSIIYGGWGAPLSDPDPQVVERGKEGVRHALRCAKALGADAVLLVPAVVNERVRYAEAYERSQKALRELLPLAEDLGIPIAVENVWNNFLLSPLEFARYVDELGSPYLRAYFDVGNVVVFGWPQDWIRTLGRRIVKVHLKDFQRKERRFVGLGEGDVNWPEVHRALQEIGYDGFLTAELGGGDEEYLREVVRRIRRIIAGEKPL